MLAAGIRYVPGICTLTCALADADLSVFALSCSPRYSNTERIIAEPGVVGPLLLLVMANTPALLSTVWSS
jgi:hypothetical protein